MKIIDRMLEFGGILYYQKKKQKFTEGREDYEEQYRERIQENPRFSVLAHFVLDYTKDYSVTIACF